jgi:DNA-binding transcriptional regulator YiaG
VVFYEISSRRIAMQKCTECKRGLLERKIVPEHEEDLGGIVVRLLNSVIAFRCSHCDYEELVIPDLLELARAVSLVRALSPARLRGKELKFIRKALDMTQKDFAEKMELRTETVSRWENDHPGTGEYCEKLLRHNVCALLYKDVLAIDYDPAVVTNMRIRPPAKEDQEPIVMERVKVKSKCEYRDAWDKAA